MELFDNLTAGEGPVVPLAQLSPRLRPHEGVGDDQPSPDPIFGGAEPGDVGQTD